MDELPLFRVGGFVVDHWVIVSWGRRINPKYTLQEGDPPSTFELGAFFAAEERISKRFGRKAKLMDVQPPGTHMIVTHEEFLSTEIAPEDLESYEEDGKVDAEVRKWLIAEGPSHMHRAHQCCQ
jgi:hypothetical protein